MEELISSNPSGTFFARMFSSNVAKQIALQATKLPQKILK